MSCLEIVRWPDPRLSTVCAPVRGVTPDIRQLAEDMLETMYAAPGRGLAAPQVGVMLRLCVMDATWKDAARSPQVFINPEVIATSADNATRAEGCLSIPGVEAEVTRPAEVTLRWTDLEGAQKEADFTGFAAACVQHELDHLDGIVTLDRLDAETRATVERAYSQVPA